MGTKSTSRFLAFLCTKRFCQLHLATNKQQNSLFQHLKPTVDFACNSSNGNRTLVLVSASETQSFGSQKQPQQDLFQRNNKSEVDNNAY